MGAGFTRAFLPDSPLMEADYGAADLAERIKGLPRASQMLDWERSRHRDGFINIERLMTRLDSLMPYDEDHGGTDEYRFLLSQVMDGFLAKLERVKNDARPHDALNNVARLCTERSVNCITFNYDDVLDQALAETQFPGSDGWHAKRGYGFYCRDSRGTTGIHWDQNIGERTPMLLLKLHGSINWRPMKGYSEPYVLDAITHHEDWPSDNSLGKEDLLLVERHLESQPLIAPPVLSKASLVRQPVLRVVWSLAYEKLAKARSVTFVGYSFPTTDMAAQTLFYEALRDLPRSAINIVTLASTAKEKETIMERYRSILGRIPERQFDFNGALSWSKRLVM